MEMKKEVKEEVDKKQSSISTERNIIENKLKSWTVRELPLFNFNCSSCGEKLPTFASYKCHLQLHTDETERKKSFQCDICKETFNDLLSLTLSPSTGVGLICCVCKNGLSSENHVVNEVHSEVLQPTELNCVQEHSAEKLIECDTLKRFCFEKDYNLHKSNHAGEFTRKSSLKRHKKLHTVSKPFQCDLCPKKFSENLALTQHKERHTGFPLKLMSDQHKGEKPFKCEKCTRSYFHKGDLRKHEKKNHSENNSYECDACPEKFAARYLLQQHKLKHANVKPFKCEKCTKSYFRKFDLKRHLNKVHSGNIPSQGNVCLETLDTKNIHSGNVQFKCDVCNKSFKDKSHLARHQVAHLNEKIFSCDLCNKTFRHKKSLIRHQLLTKEITYGCPSCSKIFLSEKDLTEHQQKYSAFECAVCKRHFKCKILLTKHEKFH
ncbi:zinc finger protein 84-like [Physella acuta]|uniref:zinc finger protein 84-like n=1 Tax=Physella acuta TaxID=109671 RepID=UPI0027DD3FF2|nr:zinc finger protein 84-like [Physella acuta]